MALDPEELLSEWALPVHPSLIRPILWMGVERKLVALNLFLVVVLLVTFDFRLVGCLIAAGFGLAFHSLSLWLTKQDPYLVEKYVRSRYYADFYPARAARTAAAPRVRYRQARR